MSLFQSERKGSDSPHPLSNKKSVLVAGFFVWWVGVWTDHFLRGSIIYVVNFKIFLLPSPAPDGAIY